MHKRITSDFSVEKENTYFFLICTYILDCMYQSFLIKHIQYVFWWLKSSIQNSKLKIWILEFQFRILNWNLGFGSFNSEFWIEILTLAIAIQNSELKCWFWKFQFRILNWNLGFENLNSEFWIHSVNHLIQYFDFILKNLFAFCCFSNRLGLIQSLRRLFVLDQKSKKTFKKFPQPVQAIPEPVLAIPKFAPAILFHTCHWSHFLFQLNLL